MNELEMFSVEELEGLESPWDWGVFWGGVGIGVALVGIAAMT